MDMWPSPMTQRTVERGRLAPVVVSDTSVSMRLGNTLIVSTSAVQTGRAELEARPHYARDKLAASSMSPLEVWGLSK